MSQHFCKSVRFSALMFLIIFTTNFAFANDENALNKLMTDNMGNGNFVLYEKASSALRAQYVYGVLDGMSAGQLISYPHLNKKQIYDMLELYYRDHSDQLDRPVTDVIYHELGIQKTTQKI